MRYDVLPISELTQRDLTAWEDLAAVAIVPNPFLEPDFVLPSMRGWDVDDAALLVVRDAGDWMAALPVRRVGSWRGVPGRCLASWRHDYCYLGTPLVRGPEPQAVLETLIRGGLQAAGIGASFALDWISADGPLARPLAAVLRSESRPVVFEEFARSYTQKLWMRVKKKAAYLPGC